MNINSKKSNSSLNEDKKGFTADDAMDQQIFYNNRKCIFDCIKSRGSIDNVVLSMKFSKAHGLFSGFFTPYHMTYSLIYKSESGVSKICKNFFELDLTKGGLLPKYITDALEDDDTFNVTLDMTDLQNLYNELNVKVDEDATFKEIIALCDRKNVTTIQLIDRVFYTRIVCYDSANEEIGTIHVGALRGLPNRLANKLYPGGSVEYTLQ